MTPRIIEDRFSEILFEQLKLPKSGYQLDGSGPVSTLTHPALTKIALQFVHEPTKLDYRLTLGEYNLLAFSNLEEAREQYPSTKIFGGFPHEIGQFMQAQPSEALINFEGIGTVFLSKIESFAPVFIPGLHHYTLPAWLDYALSGELWGPAGKWTRFHDRLHTIFANNGLLLDQDFPGFYPLKKEAQWLQNHGFQGQQNPHGFSLILPWDFPLSGLSELEKVLARGP